MFKTSKPNERIVCAPPLPFAAKVTIPHTVSDSEGLSICDCITNFFCCFSKNDNDHMPSKAMGDTDTNTAEN